MNVDADNDRLDAIRMVGLTPFAEIKNRLPTV